MLNDLEVEIGKRFRGPQLHLHALRGWLGPKAITVRRAEYPVHPLEELAELSLDACNLLGRQGNRVQIGLTAKADFRVKILRRRNQPHSTIGCNSVLGERAKDLP